MWRKASSLLLKPRNYSSSSEIPTLYSFLQPSIFALKTSPSSSDLPTPPPKTLAPHEVTSLESTLHKSLLTHNTDEAWKSFKSLTGSSSVFPNRALTNSMITHLASTNEAHNLKRAYACVVYIAEKKPEVLEFETVGSVLDALNSVGSSTAPVFALIQCLFKNRVFVPFGVWGRVVVEIGRRRRRNGGGSFRAFLRVFEECCRVALEEKIEVMKPDLAACNVALEGCCFELESVSGAEKVVETMVGLGVRPDECSFGFLAYLYALKGLEEKIRELEDLMRGFGFTDRIVFRSNLIHGYVKSGKLKFVSETILQGLRDCGGESLGLDGETCCRVVRGFLDNGNVKELATLIIEAQKLESSTLAVDRSVGYGVISACVGIGLWDKAHSILDEMNAQGGSLGLGVYVPILKAYSKDYKTAEATQLVMDISNSGLKLDTETYDTLIEASMSSQDFQSALSLFRDMREARTPDLKASYLTMMTGLMENHRPELMAAFLDEVAEDPRIEVGTHDWNSIIHAFCKAGRLEDARRTFRRMVFLQYKPNDQTYLSLISGYVSAEKYFLVLMLWHEVKRNISVDGENGLKFDRNMVDAFLYALVKGGFFDAVMQVVEKSQEMKIFVDKWRYKQAFMETHKKLKVSKLRKRSFKKMEALVAFKNWAGLNA